MTLLHSGWHKSPLKHAKVDATSRDSDMDNFPLQYHPPNPLNTGSRESEKTLSRNRLLQGKEANTETAMSCGCTHFIYLFI